MLISRTSSFPEPQVIVFIAVLQVVSGLGLIFLFLLHSGKGGGLSDMFGGGIGSQTAGSTVVEQNLDRFGVDIPDPIRKTIYEARQGKMPEGLNF